LLVPSNSGFIEIVKEPQFEDIYTIKVTSIEIARLFRKHTKSRVILNDYTRDYRFYTYALLQDIETALQMEIRDADIELLNRNISPAPVGYRCIGIWHESNEQVQLDIFAEELNEFKHENNLNFDEFLAWPLFCLTEELVAQRQPVIPNKSEEPL
jgi:hypothetical protein